jgi:hypothetical protein
MKRFTDKLNENTNGMGAISSAKFKLGLDLHGVIDSIPETFSFLTNAIVNNGGEVHIITGGSLTDSTYNENITEQLKKLNIAYTHVFSIRDYHDEVGTAKLGTHPKYGFPTIDDDTWDRTKGLYCKHHKINLHIDDTLMYNEFFNTPFARLWTHSNTPKPAHKDVRHLN